MLRSVYYGPHKIEPWCPGTGYLDRTAKNLKSYRCREPASIWQSLNPKTEDLGVYDLHVCRHCFLYTSTPADIKAHQKLCRYRAGHPGTLVYEDGQYAYYEVTIREGHGGAPPENGQTDAKAADPAENSLKLYLQCLSLMGHLFLETKSICFSVDAFTFYTAVEKSSKFVAGFFSKEKHSWHDYNLACIVIFPPWQKHGLGRRLIQLSYWLSRGLGRTGSPEKPLSTYGQLAYESFWATEIAKALVKAGSKPSSRKATQTCSISRIAAETGIDPRDVFDVLRRTRAVENNRVYVNRLLERKKSVIPPKAAKNEEKDVK